MKLLFIFTGGTIGSTLNGEYISADPTKSYSIIKAYGDEFPIDFGYSVIEPYAELSENNTGANIRVLSECVLQNINAGYDGIIVTHGTDTLQYSASAVAYALGSDTIPVCFVSSNYPIENPLSNAISNLHSAVLFIKNSLGRGVFVPYKNATDDCVKVHRATRLIAGKAFSDEMESVFGVEYGNFDKDYKFNKSEDYTEARDEISPLGVQALTRKSGGIVWLTPYPGMVYPEIDDTVKCVLLNTYHSGTIDTKSEVAKAFFHGAKKSGVKVYVTGVTGGPAYDSAKAFEELGITPLKNLSPVSAYVKLWIALDSGLNPDSVLNYSLAGDVVPEK